MKTRNLLSLSFVAMLLFSSCGGNKEEEAKKEPENAFESPIPIKRNIPEIDISDEEVPF